MPERKKRRGFLSKIRLEGTAVVGEPAHEHKGWLVLKEKNSAQEASMDKELEAQLAEILETAERFSDQHTGLVSAFDEAGEYLAKAPDNVKSAATVVYHYLQTIESAEETSDDSKPATAEVRNEETTEVTASKSGLRARLVSMLTKDATATEVETPAAEPVVEPLEEEVPKNDEFDWDTWIAGVKADVRKSISSVKEDA